MNVISASRRTDIPARYGPWLMKRIEAGCAVYKNPFGGQLHQVSLQPEEVIALVFWTKNALPFLPHLEAILSRSYKACFQYTITGYGSLLEPGVPPAPRILKNFERISDLLGAEFVRWRYDPIVIAPGFDCDFHLKNFASLASRLEGRTRVCHTSFVQFYQKTNRSFDRLQKAHGIEVEDPCDDEKISLARDLASIAATHGIRLKSCCYPLFEAAGIEADRCVDGDLIRALRPDLENLSLKTRPTRKGCRCVESRDIGAYDTCIGGCVYCYANQHLERARESAAAHDPDSERLGG
ncbi:MAG: DUF1848 domain-containing protein [Planctomycetota bacterium]|jgi:hypothetical protein